MECGVPAVSARTAHAELTAMAHTKLMAMAR
jgi:hypothetical protein